MIEDGTDQFAAANFSVLYNLVVLWRAQHLLKRSRVTTSRQSLGTSAQCEGLASLIASAQCTLNAGLVPDIASPPSFASVYPHDVASELAVWFRFMAQVLRGGPDLRCSKAFTSQSLQPFLTGEDVCGRPLDRRSVLRNE